MSAFEMEFEVQCPNDGMITVGITNIEGVKIQNNDHAELLVRCPRCGTLITVITQLPPDMPAALLHVMEAISHTMDAPLNESRLDMLFSQMEGWASASASGFGFDTSVFDAMEEEELKYSTPRELSDDEESHLGYFRNELDKLESVDDFLKRADEGN
ncbi:MAG: hypothetical protein FWD65_05400 [Coriobacteriia bacterium]|nr:hypothetical protein [Coriobacteriia bacterium]